MTTIEYMSLFLPFMVFGAWAVLASFFDIVSSDRESKVLDCILCSGVSKKKLFISKLIALNIGAWIIAVSYLGAISLWAFIHSGRVNVFLILLKYCLPLWVYIILYALLGMMISILARSSKLALIINMAIGLLLMPRFIILIIETIGEKMHWGQSVIDNMSMFVPGVILQNIANVSDWKKCGMSILLFCVTALIYCVMSFTIFISQDELNYRE